MEPSFFCIGTSEINVVRLYAFLAKYVPANGPAAWYSRGLAQKDATGKYRVPIYSEYKDSLMQAKLAWCSPDDDATV